MILKNNKGFTLFYLVIIVVGMSIAAGVAVKLIEQSVSEARKIETIKQIQEVQRALYGDSRLRDQTDFGFVGDMGRLPALLDELITDQGGNWDGPYLTAEFIEDISSPFNDGWGNPLIYDNETGQISISEESIGDEQIIIPEPYENVEEMLYGEIEGSISDSLGNPPPKGHRRHILIMMQPILTDPWPDIVFNITKDKALFHMDRFWMFRFLNRNNIDTFTDHIDRGRRHWSEHPRRNRWRWLAPGQEFDIYDDDTDDHETEYDEFGVKRPFDPHFGRFWRDYRFTARYIRDYINIKVFIHPDRFGFYEAENIPVKAYVITCYHDLFEYSLKQYVVIQPDKKVKKNFRFPFTWDVPDTVITDPPTGDMADDLLVTGDLNINGFFDTGVAVSNTGTSPITIDKMIVEWTNSRNYHKITSITIDSQNRWVGWKKAGNTLDINNVIMAAGASDLPVVFSFNRNLHGKQLTLTFIMADGTQLEVTELPMVEE